MPSTPRSPAGRIRSAEAPGPLAVRGTPAELDALVGQAVGAIRRRGKFLLVDLDRDAIACNPMLTGRFQLAAPGDKLPAKTAVVLGFGPRTGATARCRRLDPRRGVARRRTTPRPRSATATRRQMGKVYLLPAGVDRAGRRARRRTSRAPTPTTRR